MSRCPDCDPLLLATSIACGVCKSESYPSDATWITDRAILAAYVTVHEPDCTRRTVFGTILLDLDGDAHVPPLPGPRLCKGVAAATGRPCRSRAGRASAYCLHHDPARRGA